MPREATDTICIVVLAHNEERRIVRCLDSLPLNDTSFTIHVVVNGSHDATETLARSAAAATTNVIVHVFAQAGKSRSWNRIVHDECVAPTETWVFVDGDAEAVSGSIEALVALLADQPKANAAAAMPHNGRNAERYRVDMRRTHGLFGDLYALRGSFVERLRAQGLRLPEDLIGDDGLVGALVKTDLQPLDHWDDTRVAICETAGFLCEPVKLNSPASWSRQYRRMINYSVRHFQNQIITLILRDQGPFGVPRQLATLYEMHLDGFRARRDLSSWWFDTIALRRMRAMASRA